MIINVKSPANILSTLSATYEQILNSIILAVLSTFGVLIIGIPLAYLSERTNVKLKGLIIGLAILPLIITGSAIGMGLIKIYNNSFLILIYKSIFIVILGLVARFVVVPTLIFGGALKMLDPSLENASKVSGAPWYRTWARIILPLSKQPLVISAIICFILALNELSVVIMVTPPGFNTISVRIYSLYHFNRNVEVAAMCLIMSFLTILLYVILSSVIYKGKEVYGNQV
jgi:iron(III) transport system permease protein